MNNKRNLPLSKYTQYSRFILHHQKLVWRIYSKSLSFVVIALEVANDAFEERGDSTGLRESLDTLVAPRDENTDLTNNKA
jgi:hypothetical protein